ncbi:MAG TPA: GNAT family N-acetyltransferase [Tenuifilaceae bacterium]|nr:GNAT family N-acetyltransferase [Tenuifilaceae bacterium]HPN21237.1 GNAT family N-acetyltransferase [Tenuifilaceae bacterium]
MEIKSLANIHFDVLFESFAKAFADYEIQPDMAELQKMLHRRGFVPGLSFGAFDNGNLVSFTFNGIGNFNGIKTAYDTGTGTLKDYRAQGLASKVFNESIPFLVDAGVEQYLLEVLQHNTSAVSVYRKQGFEVTREFNYFVQQMQDITPNSKSIHKDYSICEVKLSDLTDISNWWDFNPSWQNSFEAINRKPEDFLIVGVKKGSALVGYGILEPSSGDITQIAVDKNHRRKGVASAILKELLKRNSCTSVKLINADISCVAITKLLEENGILLKGKQFEMIRKLR